MNGGSSCGRSLALTACGFLLTVAAVGTGPIGWGILAASALDIASLANAAYDCGVN